MPILNASVKWTFHQQISLKSSQWFCSCFARTEKMKNKWTLICISQGYDALKKEYTSIKKVTFLNVQKRFCLLPQNLARLKSDQFWKYVVNSEIILHINTTGIHVTLIIYFDDYCVTRFMQWGCHNMESLLVISLGYFHDSDVK